jgi:hypothetical protein
VSEALRAAGGILLASPFSSCLSTIKRSPDSACPGVNISMVDASNLRIIGSASISTSPLSRGSHDGQR